MSNPHPTELQTAASMNESESLQDRELWANDHHREIHARDLPWEDPPWRQDAEEPLSIAAVFYALMAIRKGKSREAKPGLLKIPREQIFDPVNWEEVNRPPEDAVRIITRALQEGEKGEKLIKKALELKPRAKGAILARHIARNLSKPKGAVPKNVEEWQRFISDKGEWVKPSKQEVERKLESLYPEIYNRIPKKDGAGGKLLRSDFWDDAGLKDAIDQTRGNK